MRSLLLFVLLFICTGVAAQQPFRYDFWLNEANNPVQVNDILQSPTGYIWVATNGGLYSFNGREFRYYPDSIRKPVTALALRPGNFLYIGYADGTIAYLNEDDRVTPYNIVNESPHSAINNLYWDAGGVLWICTRNEGIIAAVNGIGIQLNERNGLSSNNVYTVSRNSKPMLLAGTSKGINELYIEQGRVVIKQMPGNRLSGEVTALAAFPGKDWYWVGMQSGGVAIFNPATQKEWTPNNDTSWAWGQVNDILPVSDNKAWIATEDGYVIEARITDSTHARYRPFLYNSKKINRLTLGRSGVIWAATNQGVTLLSAEYMEYVELSSPYKLSEVRAVCCDKNNTVWYSQGNALYSINKASADPVRPALVCKAPGNIVSLYCDMENRIWIGTMGKGILYRDTMGNLNTVKDIPELNNTTILSIAGTDDRLWMSGVNGVQEVTYPGPFTKKMSLIRQHNKKTGVGSNFVYQVFPDRKGRIWMATDGSGICMYTDGLYKHWDSSSGINAPVIYSVAQDAAGNIWASGQAAGLYMFDGNRWRQMTREQGLQDLSVVTIAPTATGQVAAVHAKGIDVWYPLSRQFRNYNKRPGVTIDSTSTMLNLAARDEYGNVYIPFEKGFIIYKNIYVPSDIRPMAHIVSQSVFFKPVDKNKTFFSYDQNHISFKFDGMNFANSDRLRYRYKLDGFNDSWIITSDESITFPQLPPGTYTFRVQASMNSTFSRLGEASWSFTIDKPFWWRIWFIALVVLLIIGIGYGYLRFREENLKKVSLLERERMMFEYEHLKSQVNPHFLFNSLNTLASLIEEDDEIAVKYTVHLSDLYRNMLSYRDKDLISLREEWEILENYFYIQQSRFGSALRLKANVPEVYMETKKVVPLALQLLVENAIKHNVVSKSSPLTITIEATDDAISIRNPLQLKMSKEKGAGLGLVNIRRRYELLTRRQVIYGEVNKEYIVTLPLL